MEHCSILIIGAGMAGLACAKALSEADRDVVVIDKGRGPGGRMATRRAEIGGEVVSFDHGAQYFTARDPLFAEALASWERLGVVARWPAAGEEAWVGVPGMNGPIRAQTRGLDIRWSTRAVALAREEGNWIVTCENEIFMSETVLVAIPAEQASDMLEQAVPEYASIAGSVTSEPCWAVMAGFAQPLDIAADAVRAEKDDAPIAWAARNSAKPERRSTKTGFECWVFHASSERSKNMIDLPREQVAPLLLSEFFDQTGIAAAAPLHLTAHRWLYAMPSIIEGDAARFDTDLKIGIAGDYLHSPRVEGAWLSGRALAEQVMAST